MKVHVPKKTLATALAKVERVIPNRSSNPGLTLLRLSIGNDKLVLAGSSMDIDLETSIKADAGEEGQVALPAAVFSQIVRALPGEMVELSFTEKQVKVSSGSFETKLQLMEASQAPRFEFPEELPAEVQAEELMHMLKRVRYAAAVADYQAVFRGVKVELGEEGVRAVGTDGFRLALFDHDEGLGLEQEIIVPSKSVDEMLRLLDEGTVRLTVAENRLSLAGEAFRMNVALMDGSFPDYRRIIPNSSVASATLPAKELSNALTRVSLLSDKSANNRVDVHIKDGVMTITAEGAYGRSEEQLDVLQEGTDEEHFAAFNATYLTDALAGLEGEATLAFSGGTAPTLVRAAEEPEYLAMVVPLRTA